MKKRVKSVFVFLLTIVMSMQFVPAFSAEPIVNFITNGSAEKNGEVIFRPLNQESTIVRSNIEAYRGEYSYEVSPGGEYRGYVFEGFQIDAGKTYRFSGFVKSESVITLCGWLCNLGGDTKIEKETNTLAGQWLYFSFDYVAPVTAANAYFQFHTKQTGDYYLDNIAFYELPVGEYENQLIGGDFENPDVIMPYFYGGDLNAPGTSSMTYVADGGYQGGGAMQLTFQNGWTQARQLSGIRLEAGATYEMSAKIKTTGESAGVFFDLYYASDHTAEFTVTQSYQEYTVRFVVPEGADVSAPFLGIGATSSNAALLVDDVEFRKITPEEAFSQIRNGTAEGTAATGFASQAGGRMTVTSDDWYEGTHSWLIEPEIDYDAFIQDHISVEAGKTYRFSGWAKLKEGTEGMLRVDYRNMGGAGDRDYRIDIVNTQWRRFDFYLKAPITTDDLWLFFWLDNSTNDFMLDNISFTECEALPGVPTVSIDGGLFKDEGGEDPVDLTDATAGNRYYKVRSITGMADYDQPPMNIILAVFDKKNNQLIDLDLYAVPELAPGDKRYGLDEDLSVEIPADGNYELKLFYLNRALEPVAVIQ